MLLNDGADSVATMQQICHEHPFWAKKIENGRVLPFSSLTDESYLQRQDLPLAYIYDGALYVRRSCLLDRWNGKDFCLGKDIRGIVPDGFASLHIDDFVNLETARAVFRLIRRNTRRE
jgi:CMP-N-acetylneuraminic acid synthetase